jgi:5,5'-dehydrodivanillate O-demethylase oxygenase subunit
VLTEDQNKQLTQVALGTPMGELLRRYWHPVAAVEELEERPTRPVRIFGEDLVLFKCGEDGYGLIDRYCAHRLTDLAYGMVEDCTLRCPRHGWAYSDTGVCVDQPMEEELIEVRLNAYKATAKAGMVWVYLGPEPAPLVPDWEPFHSQEDALVQVVLSVLHCNWLQCQENTMDGIDMELMEAAFAEAQRTGVPPALPDAAFGYDEFEHGYLVRNTAGSAASVTKTSIWPNALFAGDARSCRLEWRVPMDDETTLIMSWFLDRPDAGAKLELPATAPYWYAETRDDKGEALKSHRLNQKYAVWLNQAPIVDRAKEVLMDQDEGVVTFRNKLFSQMQLIEDGAEPKGLIFDPGRNRRLHLPFTEPLTLPTEGEGEEQPALDFPWLAGQPEEVAEYYRKVAETWHQPHSSGDA